MESPLHSIYMGSLIILLFEVNMTQIIYELGRLEITQSECIINFKVSDLTYESRQNLIKSIKDIGE